MGSWLKYVALFLVLAILGVVTGELEQSLHYYEVLFPSDISHSVVRRSAVNHKLHTKDVSVTTLGRKFRLRLHSRYGLLSNGFKAIRIDGKGKERRFDVDESEFYEGYVEGDPKSDVHAYWDKEDNAMTATIKTSKDIYVIEPSWRHIDKAHNFTMISYRGSDMKKSFEKKHPNGTMSHESFCGFVDAGRDEASYNVSEADIQEAENLKKRRMKRASGARNTCQLLLTADYKFFQEVGQKSLLRTTNYLIGLIDRVNSVYRNTDFGSGFKGYGFEIKEIRVHEAFTVPERKEELHYNMDKNDWQTKDLLTVFSRDSYYRDFCLSHLFTSIAFSGGVLGLAYIGSPRAYSVGGICSPVYSSGGYNLYLNTGWSTALNKYGSRILTQEADIVTTHEFGHNWGSEHDPDTEECSPSSSNGGQFIMATYAVSGYERNNKLFSGCSRRSMGAVLRAKSATCFAEKQGALCGNNKVEDKEECDAGPMGLKGMDPCCDKFCRLKTGAVCSDSNFGCCLNCKIRPSGDACFGETTVDDSEGCEEAAKCDGINAKCPTPDFKRDNTTCQDKGICRNGICQSFCFSKGKDPCICDEIANSCFWCCRAKTPNATCKPEMDANAKQMNLPDGKPCKIGFCTKGVCEKQVQDLVERFWDVIENITVDKVLLFMRANIVGTIILFSLVLWIPLSCIISYVDRKRRREEEEEIAWLSAENKKLVLDKDRDKIIKAERTRQRRPPAGSVVRDSTPARSMDKISSL